MIRSDSASPSVFAFWQKGLRPETSLPAPTNRGSLATVSRSEYRRYERTVVSAGRTRRETVLLTNDGGGTQDLKQLGSLHQTEEDAKQASRAEPGRPYRPPASYSETQGPREFVTRAETNPPSATVASKSVETLSPQGGATFADRVNRNRFAWHQNAYGQWSVIWL